MTARARRLRRNLAVAALSLATTALVASLAAHLLAARLPGTNGPSGFFAYGPGDGLRPRASQDSRFTRPATFRVRTDARGLRVASDGRAPSDDVDVLLVGCSFAFGWGVDHEASLAGRLAAVSGLEVAVAGVPGGSTASAAYAVERHATLHPEAVVYVAIEDHLRRNVARCASVPLFGCVPPPRVVEHDRAFDLVPAPARTDAFDDAVARGRMFASNRVVDSPRIALTMLAAGVTVAGERLRPTPPSAPPAAAFAFALRALAERARHAGADLFVVFVPERLDGTVRVAPAEVAGAIPAGARFVDASPVVAALDPSQGPLGIPGDGHPTARTHDALARQLAPVLRAHAIGALAPAAPVREDAAHEPPP